MGISHDLKHLFFCILEQRNNFLSLLKMDHSAPEQRLSLVGRTSSPFSALKYYSTPFKNTAKGLFGYCSQISPQVPQPAPFLPAPGWPFAGEAATLNFRCWDPTASGHTLKAGSKSSRPLPCDYEKASQSQHSKWNCKLEIHQSILKMVVSDIHETDFVELW